MIIKKYFYFSFSWKIIDTPQFQRLRDLHQLGANYLVFPSANHSRFEHSLGTGHLCQELIANLKYNSINTEIPEELKRGIVTAGLCHNIGHGPYSYPFTDFVKEVLNFPNWDNVEAGMMLLDDIVDKNYIDLSQDELKIVKDVIIGEKRHSSHIPNWALQILHNKTNGVDVDKFDFIKRDTKKLGLSGQAFDSIILLKTAKIINNEICYRTKDAFSFYELYQCRYRLFKEFYLHRVTKGIDLMIKDIFTEANAVYKFSEYIHDPEMYIRLNDYILQDLFYSKKGLNKNKGEGMNPSLKAAKDLVKRIFKRDIYKFVGEKTCLPSSTNFEKFFNLTEEDILNSADSDGFYKEEHLVKGDIKIMKCKLDYCKGEEDPVKYVNFYQKKNEEHVVETLDRFEISFLTPSHFSEMIFRVYVKDAKKLKSAREAFNNFCKRIVGEEPHQYEKKSGSKADKLTANGGVTGVYNSNNINKVENAEKEINKVK